MSSPGERLEPDLRREQHHHHRLRQPPVRRLLPWRASTTILLNENMDSTLFRRDLHRLRGGRHQEEQAAFPIVTLIIMECIPAEDAPEEGPQRPCNRRGVEAMATPLMAEYIKYIYKTARKFWASVGVVTPGDTGHNRPVPS